MNSPTTDGRPVAPSSAATCRRISRLRAGGFYLALEGEAFHEIKAPWCLSHHPSSPPTTAEVPALAQRNVGPR